MRIGMTMMVRDEADIIRTNLEYYLDEGIDVILVTDNGSTDGTAEILADLARSSRIHLSHDPVHRKQQSSVVTAMARRLSTEFGVDWVVNADADEFLVPRDRSSTLREAFELIPAEIGSFVVPVVNMVGPLMSTGFPLDELTWRDHREPEQLRRAGVFAHPSSNAIHVGRDDVTVAQGNHAVSITSRGTVPPEAALEVLHFPWRSWAQYAHRVQISGAAYLANPEMAPSANHHGMTDFRRLGAGVLLPYFAARVPAPDELERDPSFVRDESLIARVRSSRGSWDAAVPLETELLAVARAAGRELIARDIELRERIAELEVEAAGHAALARQLESDLQLVRAENDALRARKSVRAVDAVSRSVRQLRPGGPRATP